LGFGDDLALPSHERALWARAEALLPARGIEPYTQGLMDLGATLCTARAPRCDACPLVKLCAAHAEGRPERYPLKTRTLRRSARHNTMLWLAEGERLWLVQRPARGVWAGLWALPLYDDLDAVRALTRAWPGRGQALDVFTHALTHFDWQLEPWRHVLPRRLSAANRRVVEADVGDGRWFTQAEALALGLPAPVRKLISTAS
jgi:A/G-specific adenine glycosylase